MTIDRLIELLQALPPETRRLQACKWDRERNAPILIDTVAPYTIEDPFSADTSVPLAQVVLID